MSILEKIFEAIGSNDLGKLKNLLAAAKDIDSTEFKGLTPLMYAAKLGRDQMAIVLLEHGANPQLKDRVGKTAYIYALEQNNELLRSVLGPVSAEAAEKKPNDEVNDALALLFGHKISNLMTGALTSNTKKIKHEKSTDKAKNPSTSVSHVSLSNDAKIADPELSLKDFIGQEDAKRSIKNILSVAQVSIARQKKGLPDLELNFHAVFQGNPGTGKTTFARYYAQEIKKLGLLSKGQLLEVSRKDLVAEYQGQTAGKTAAVVANALGGILFIDEAYALKSSKDDHYGQEAIDTLVKEIEDHRADLIVILAGYSDEMRAFLHLNPGMNSRIPNNIHFADFTDDELVAIFNKMLLKNKMLIEEKALDLVREEIRLARTGKSFGNAREVRNIFERALIQQSNRLVQSDLNALSTDELSQLIYSDLTQDPHDLGSFEQLAKNSKQQATATQKLMQLHGLQNIKKEIRQLTDYMRVSKARTGGSSLQSLSLHMIFVGNPGTGKTTVARLMVEIFKEIGVLGSGHLIEVDRSDLVSGYQGQTAIKTKEIIESAIGGILFVDEAYSLARGQGQDSYGQEAIDTLLKFMEDLRGQLVVILAGYSREMELFLASNTGRKSRFSKVLEFEDFTELEVRQIAKDMVEGHGFLASDDAYDKLADLMGQKRVSSKSFANARTLRQLLADAYKRHAARIAKLGDLDKLDHKVLNTLTLEDFELN